MFSSIFQKIYGYIPTFTKLNREQSEKENPQPQRLKNKPYKKKNIPKVIRNKVWRKYCGNTLDSKCFCCHHHLSYECWEAGHVIPESKGGHTCVDNLRPICLSCNRSMGTQNMIEFMEKYKMEGSKGINKIEKAKK
jgi:5-methylcytosine-specific restriction endonuclease McrA